MEKGKLETFITEEEKEKIMKWEANLEDSEREKRKEFLKKMLKEMDEDRKKKRRREE